MGRLFITGDSFSVADVSNDIKLWSHRTAEKLGLTLINNSMHGASQDWAWMCIDNWLPNMTKDDQLVVILTHPAREWYFEDKPHITNFNIIDLEDQVGNERVQAMVSYAKHIQRLPRDIARVEQRLAWLSLELSIRDLNPTLIIKAFDQDIGRSQRYQNLKWANGTLNRVQINEFKIPDVDNINNIWRGIDTRYNHMILDNHEILADKIVDYFTQGNAIDLNNGFIESILDENSMDDKIWTNQQLDPVYVEKWRSDESRTHFEKFINKFKF
jgi:hypothetical protein